MGYEFNNLQQASFGTILARILTGYFANTLASANVMFFYLIGLTTKGQDPVKVHEVPRREQFH
jgi:hypothetical protein